VSLINKMLQDLDARQTSATAATHLYTKPVARREMAAPSRALLAGAAGAVVVLAVAGAFGWRHWHKPAAAKDVPRPVKVVRVNPVPVQAPMPAAPAPTPAPVQPAVIEPVVAAPAEPAHAATSHPRADTLTRKERRELKRAAQREARKLAAAPVHLVAARQKAGDAGPPAQGRDETPAQRAEAAYHRALSSLQEGYVNEAIGALDQALQANPRHDAARQTLVGLLIENKRVDEAMRQLQLGLTLDPRQPAMAMLLARLQIERGGTGIETLMRTLPYAGPNSDYHAFLAGALQRQQRHREAAEQYQAALQGAPQNGVWWMGLGISLQAEKRDGEAVDAFRKSRATGTLNAELLSFVERKIQQLGR
jgi:MSHA biogenesis protein MshN